MGRLIINEAFLQEVELLQMLIKNNVAGAFGGNRNSKSYGSSCEFTDYRDYMPGDDITKIDWNAYARFDKLYQKLYLDERQMHTRIYIDASRSMEYGDGKKAEKALAVAATFAYLSVSAMDRVSVYVIQENKATEIISGITGKQAFLNEIGKLNDIEFTGDCSISKAILPEKLGFGDGMSIIISDFLTDNDYEDAIDLLAGKKRHIMCVQILSRAETNPQSRGKMHFFDSESAERFYRKNIDKEIMRAYREALKHVQERVKNYCSSRGADYMMVSTEDSLSEIFYGKLVDMGVLK